jgi:hypothetical protein
LRYSGRIGRGRVGIRIISCRRSGKRSRSSIISRRSRGRGRRGRGRGSRSIISRGSRSGCGSSGIISRSGSRSGCGSSSRIGCTITRACAIAGPITGSTVSGSAITGSTTTGSTITGSTITGSTTTTITAVIGQKRDFSGQQERSKALQATINGAQKSPIGIFLDRRKFLRLKRLRT